MRPAASDAARRRPSGRTAAAPRRRRPCGGVDPPCRAPDALILRMRGLTRDSASPAAASTDAARLPRRIQPGARRDAPPSGRADPFIPDAWPSLASDARLRRTSPRGRRPAERRRIRRDGRGREDRPARAGLSDASHERPTHGPPVRVARRHCEKGRTDDRRARTTAPAACAEPASSGRSCAEARSPSTWAALPVCPCERGSAERPSGRRRHAPAAMPKGAPQKRSACFRSIDAAPLRTSTKEAVASGTYGCTGSAASPGGGFFFVPAIRAPGGPCYTPSPDAVGSVARASTSVGQRSNRNTSACSEASASVYQAICQPAPRAPRTSEW